MKDAGLLLWIAAFVVAAILLDNVEFEMAIMKVAAGIALLVLFYAGIDKVRR